jgi:hypothetical protein
MFNGEALAGTNSDVDVLIGELTRAGSVFAFPGVSGVFERSLGTRERPITWRGELRAAADSELNSMEAAIEARVREARVGSVADPWGRTFDSCVPRSFERLGPRRVDLLTGEALQEFELRFAQLGA